jgi:hypothetical protein
MVSFVNHLKTEAIMRKFQKLAQKWKDLKNNGTTWILILVTKVDLRP